MGEALGIIQTDGLVALIAAMDAMLKTSAVKLGSIELVKGGSMVLVRVRGRMAEVQAAVEAGAAVAKTISNGRVVASVIGNALV